MTIVSEDQLVLSADGVGGGGTFIAALTAGGGAGYCPDAIFAL